MKICRSINELRGELAQAWRPVALVPTMGALHAGHVSLVDAARHAAGDLGTVVVSLFVNPTQFGQGEDFEAYPRDFESDARLCREHGADLVFAPPVGEMFADDASIEVRETLLSKRLCGASRPGHFTGVCTVVLKFFNIVRPDIAVFGKKDFQQVAVIRRMTRDLMLAIQVIGCETVRERDGLAMSSRNRYLSPDERTQATAIRTGLLACRDSGQRDAGSLISRFRDHFARYAPLGRIDYVELVDSETMRAVDSVEGECLMAVAARFGNARLIDNIELNQP